MVLKCLFTHCLLFAREGEKKKGNDGKLDNTLTEIKINIANEGKEPPILL